MPKGLALFVGSWLSYSETFIYDQVRHQSRFKAEVFARRWGSHASAFPYPHVNTLSVWEEAKYAVGRSRAFDRRIDESGAEVVHCHFGTNGVLALPYLRKRSLPLVVTFHGHDVAGLMPNNARTLRYFRYQRLAPEMFDRASLLLCCSDELAARLLEIGAPEQKMVVHRLGVDLSRFAVPDRPDRPATMLMIGRMVEKKGMTYGLRAFAAVRAEHPNIELRLVGDGPLAKTLRELADDLGIASAVTFVGIRDADGVRAELEAADVLMAPSVVGRHGDRESGVIVLKEAGATGLPTVGTEHGGIPEIIDDGVTGFLVPERDVDTLAERLRVLVADKGLRRRLGAAARSKIEREYDTVRQNERLEDHLASVL